MTVLYRKIANTKAQLRIIFDKKINFIINLKETYFIIVYKLL